MSDLISETDPEKAAKQLADHLNTSPNKGGLSASPWCNHGKYRVYINGVKSDLKVFYDLKEDGAERLSSSETKIGECWTLATSYTDASNWQELKRTAFDEVVAGFDVCMQHIGGADVSVPKPSAPPAGSGSAPGDADASPVAFDEGDPPF
ncbi:MAG: hypothetical protein ISN29_03170 [Gammaproteobacteria bacterium AqS3]|nr:hypothetical protein [Gammaproteobacteria bacterium AqS3]